MQVGQQRKLIGEQRSARPAVARTRTHTQKSKGRECAAEMKQGGVVSFRQEIKKKKSVTKTKKQERR